MTTDMLHATFKYSYFKRLILTIRTLTFVVILY